MWFVVRLHEARLSPCEGIKPQNAENTPFKVGLDVSVAAMNSMLTLPESQADTGEKSPDVTLQQKKKKPGSERLLPD